MSLMDGLFLTAVNAAACIVLPKLLSMFLTAKSKQAKLSLQPVKSNDTSNELPSFPY